MAGDRAVAIESSNTLGVEVQGPGLVRLPGQECLGSCSYSLLTGTVATLTAEPVGPARFVGWEGGCTGTASECGVTIDSDKSVVARFAYLNNKKPFLKKVRRISDRSMPLVIGCGGSEACHLRLSGKFRGQSGKGSLEPLFFDIAAGERRQVNLLQGQSAGTKTTMNKAARRGKPVQLSVDLIDLDTSMVSRMAINEKPACADCIENKKKNNKRD